MNVIIILDVWTFQCTNLFMYALPLIISTYIFSNILALCCHVSSLTF